MRVRISKFSLYKIMFIILLLPILINTACSPLNSAIQTNHANTFTINEKTISQIHVAFKNKTISCKQLVQHYINRINKYDKKSKLNAIVMLNANAMNKAQSLDKEMNTGNKLRPLHCIPVILKDNYDTADMPTSGGSLALKNSYPPDDAYMVKKLRQAGAIILAKSNMAEWAFSPYYTVSSTLGTTSNAYDTERVPAGSSGGTASAVAANFGAIGMGTDTGNSIRGPASHTALVGIRSTIGVTSRDGVIPLLLNRDIAGPMTRTVEDAARVFNVIAGYDPADSSTKASAGHIPDSYIFSLQKDGLENARIGVLRHISDTATIDFEIKELFEKSIADLKKSGATIVDPVTIPNFDKLVKTTGFCSRFRYDINNYFASLGTTAVVNKLSEVVKSGKFLPSSKGGLDWGMSKNVAPEEHEIPCVDVQGDPRRLALLNAVVNAMNKHEVDVLIYPSWNNPPRLIGDLESPHGNNSPIIAPHSGQPAITVPMGFTSNGLPAGLQLLGRPFSEGELFKFAYAYEQATQHRKPPSLFP